MRAAALPTPVEIDLAALDATAEGLSDSRNLDSAPPRGLSEPAASMTRPRALEASRLDALDAARVVATLGIIWTHVAEAQGLSLSAGALGRFGTSFYIIAAALFIVRSCKRTVQRPWLEDTKRRAQRLLLPYLTWSLIYGVLYAQGGRRLGQSWESITFWWGPVAGTALHLWFLPFIFFWGAVGTWLTPRLFRVPKVWLFAAGPVLCLALYWLAYRHIFFAVDRYWLWEYHLHRLDRWIDEVPVFVAAVIGGVTFFRLPTRAHRWMQAHLAWLVLIGAATFLVSQILYGQHVDYIKDLTHTEGRFVANVAGLGLLVAFLGASKARWLARLAPLGRYTYLAFLSHMLVLEAVRVPLQSIPAQGSALTAVVSTAVVFGLSLALSRVIAGTRWLSWLRP